MPSESSPRIRPARLVAALLATALAFVFAPAAPPAHAQAASVTLQSAPGIVAVGQAVVARTRVAPAAPGIMGFTEAWVNGRWSRSQVGYTNAAGDFTLELTYGKTAPGAYLFRMGAVVGGVTLYTKTFTITRTPAVGLLAAPGRTQVGKSVTARGRVTPIRSGQAAFVEVWYGSRWARIQQGTTNSAGEFTLPLSYGVSTVGTYSFRLGATVNGKTGYTKYFNVTRTASGSVTLQSAPGTLKVGTTGTARARISPVASGRTGFAEVWVGKWARVSSATTNSSGDFTVPLAYGVSKAGSYTFRLGATISGHNVYTKQFTVTRTATSTPTPAPVYYANCTAVRDAGKAPLYRGQPGYASHLDRDGDGIACE